MSEQWYPSTPDEIRRCLDDLRARIKHDAYALEAAYMKLRRHHDLIDHAANAKGSRDVVTANRVLRALRNEARSIQNRDLLIDRGEIPVHVAGYEQAPTTLKTILEGLRA
jgi:hypothetical protein